MDEAEPDLTYNILPSCSQRHKVYSQSGVRIRPTSRRGNSENLGILHHTFENGQQGIPFAPEEEIFRY